MRIFQVTEKEFEPLCALQTAYKAEIGEEAPDDAAFLRLRTAVSEKEIMFYACEHEGEMIAMCSVCRTFSTFDYRPSGVFEDFYIHPDYRKKGAARALADFAARESGASTLLVGCAPCDEGMYRSLGFDAPLGRLLSKECKNR